MIGTFFAGHETARIVHGMDKEYLVISSNEKLKTCQDVIARFE